MKKQLDDIKEIDAPDIMTSYIDYFQKYLENEILFYESFLNGDTKLSEKYQVEANNMYANTEEEIKKIEESFNSKALQLGVGCPFD